MEKILKEFEKKFLKGDFADVLEDRGDEWHDLCLVCPDCGYDERKQKEFMNGDVIQSK
jgi:hypothetical protein